jgi:hypothetical protein
MITIPPRKVRMLIFLASPRPAQAAAAYVHSRAGAFPVRGLTFVGHLPGLCLCDLWDARGGRGTGIFSS